MKHFQTLRSISTCAATTGKSFESEHEKPPFFSLFKITIKDTFKRAIPCCMLCFQVG